MTTIVSPNLLPATFFVSANSNAGQSIGGEGTLLLYEDNIIDDDGLWTGNNTFTAPYDCEVHISMVNCITAGSGAGCGMLLNGTVIKTDNTNVTTTMSYIVTALRLSQGDEVACYSQDSRTRNTNETRNAISFTGRAI